MTRPRRSAPGIAFAADRAGRFYSGKAKKSDGAEERQTLDIFAAGRRQESAERTRRVMGVVGGSALLALALSTRGLLGALLALGGAALVVRGVTGRSLAQTARLAAEKVRPDPY